MKRKCRYVRLQKIEEINRLRMQEITDETIRADMDTLVAALKHLHKSADEIAELSSKYLKRRQGKP